MTKIIIIEDVTITAIDVQDQREEYGFEGIGIVGSVERAMRWLDFYRSDVTVLDMRLGDGTSKTVAEQLVRQGVPVVIYSDGYRSGIFKCCEDAPWVGKPCSSAELVKAVLQALEWRNPVAGA